MGTIGDDLETAVRCLEECVQCVAGCECWMPDGRGAWDDEDKLRGAAARSGDARVRETLAAFERIAALSDVEASRCGPAFSLRLHGATAPPDAPYDPRAFFARALGTLRALRSVNGAR
jgi:hypothetical protein